MADITTLHNEVQRGYDCHIHSFVGTLGFRGCALALPCCTRSMVSRFNLRPSELVVPFVAEMFQEILCASPIHCYKPDTSMAQAQDAQASILFVAHEAYLPQASRTSQSSQSSLTHHSHISFAATNAKVVCSPPAVTSASLHRSFKRPEESCGFKEMVSTVNYTAR